MIVQCADAQLALGISPPAEGDVLQRDATAVFHAHTYMRELKCAGDADRKKAVTRSAVAQLAHRVETPAISQILQGHGTGMIMTCAHLAERQGRCRGSSKQSWFRCRWRLGFLATAGKRRHKT